MSCKQEGCQLVSILRIEGELAWHGEAQLLGGLGGVNGGRG